MIAGLGGNTAFTVDTLLRGEVQLASPPEIFLQVSEVIEDPSKSNRDVERIIHHDPALATRLLRLANSAYYGFPRQIASLSRAISIIGLQELRDLVLSTVMVERFSRLPNRLMDMREFWRASVRCALWAKYLGRRQPRAKTLRSVFVCGLLHEIGRLVVYAKIPELARAAILLSEAEGIEETQAERATYGFDHYQVGAELAHRWRLPEVFVATLKGHGTASETSAYPRETALMTLASRLSLTEIESPERLEETLPELSSLLDFLGLKAHLLPEVLAEVESQFEEIFHLLFDGRV